MALPTKLHGGGEVDQRVNDELKERFIHTHLFHCDVITLTATHQILPLGVRLAMVATY